VVEWAVPKKAPPPPTRYIRHTGGVAWGVGVLVSQTREQRTYLFADGEQRTFKEQFCERFIVDADPPDDETTIRLARGLKAGGGDATPVAVQGDLEAQIHANPDDPGPYLVYADWLQHRGDPRGDLITIQHQLAESPTDRAKRTAEKKVLDEFGGYFHPKALAELLALPKRGEPSARTEVTWRTGFYERIRIARPSDRYPELAPALTEALAHPSAGFLRSIVLGPLGTSKYLYAPLLAVIQKAKPALLEELVIGDFTDERNELAYSSAGNLCPVINALPALTRLRVRAGTVRFESQLKHPVLRELAIETVDLPDPMREKLFAARLPALETLELDAPKADWLSVLQRSPNAFPALRRLTLRHTRRTGELLESLLHSPLLARLQVLELTDGDLTDAAMLSVQADRIAHLRRLDLGGNPLTRPALIRIAQLGNVVVERTRAPDAPITAADVADLTDPESLAVAKRVARPSKWFALMHDGERLTGRYRGTGVYYVSARMDRNDADCSCPSPKNPCKHALALLLIAASGYAFRPAAG
jgi:uncharacterized protein (TIGR02996 family)